MRSRLPITLVSILCLSAVARGVPRDISDLVRPIQAKHQTPALFGAIVELDGASAVGAAGVRKLGSPDPVTVDDQIHLGSDTKAMTAVLVAQLVERGELAWDTKMEQAFPDLAPRMNPALAKVTIEQLLNHRGGLLANVDWKTFAAGQGPVEAQRQRIVEAVLTGKPAYAPGSQYAYSNLGYALLGAIVEAKAKQPWEAVIRKRMFEPLSMGSAGFGAPGTPGGLDQPWGHVIFGGIRVPTQNDNPPPLGPAGTVHCSIADWAKFIAWTLRCERGDTPMLTRAMHRRLVTPMARNEYAGGWLVTTRPWAGGRVLTHAGSNTYWYCVAWLAPERGFAVLAATNVGDDDAKQACDELSAALIAERTRVAATISDTPTTVPTTRPTAH